MLEVAWESLDYVEPTKESVKRIKRLGIGTAVWKIFYRFKGTQLVFIGETDSHLHDRVREAILRATQRNWEEFFRCALTKKVGFAELFVWHVELERAERRKKVALLIEEEEEADGTIVLNEKGRPSWPDWLWEIYARSITQAMDDHRRRGQLAEFDERLFRELVGKLETLSPVHLSIQNDDAIDDLDQPMPQRVLVSGTRFQRDMRVRTEVMKRAKGRCEFCGMEGFLCPDGSRYLECHHIIRLADQGPDTAGNVIALCSEHHREAPFGERADWLEERMKEKLSELGSLKSAMATMGG